MPILPGGAGGLPMLGLGLWEHPTASAALEVLIVGVGAAMYWRAANGVAGDDAAMKKRARLCGAGVLVAGLLTLGLNLIGM